MRRIRLFVIVVAFWFVSGSVLWGDEDAKETHPGMEEKKVGDARMMLPQGSRIYKHGDLQVIEGAGEYAARKLMDMDVRLAKVENDNGLLRKELENIKTELSNMKKAQVLVK